MGKETTIKVSGGFKEFLRGEKEGDEDFQATIERLIKKASIPVKPNKDKENLVDEQYTDKKTHTNPWYTDTDQANKIEETHEAEYTDYPEVRENQNPSTIKPKIKVKIIKDNISVREVENDVEIKVIPHDPLATLKNQIKLK